MKYGLEVEFFGQNNKKEFVDVSLLGIPHDEFPLLVEARGEPNFDIYQAVFSVKAEIEKIVNLMNLNKITPVFLDWLEKDKQVKSVMTQILRRGIHKQISWENLYDLDVSEKNETHLAAGMHISFTDEGSYLHEKGVFKYNKIFDFLKLFKKIEKEFGREIEASGRTKGFYEIKPDGRVEYRSLPATLILNKNFVRRLSGCLK